MKNITILILAAAALALSFTSTVTYKFHVPDFTEAHYYGPDSSWVVKEFYADGSPKPSTLSLINQCDFSECLDSVATYMKYKGGKKGPVTSYKKWKKGVWIVSVDGKKTGDIVRELWVEEKTELVPCVDDDTGNYFDMELIFLDTKMEKDTVTMKIY